MTNLHTLLLKDNDGDGLYDALAGKLFLPERPDVSTLRAASEVMALLASRAVRLTPEFAVWKHDADGFFIGRYPPQKAPKPVGFEVSFTKHGLAFTASSNTELLEGANWCSQWPLLFEEASLEEISLQLNAKPKRLGRHLGRGWLELSQSLGEAPDWKTLPSTLAEIRTPNAVYINPKAELVKPRKLKPPKFENLLSLGAALQGGGLYSGTPYHPELLRGGFAIAHPVKEAVTVAARLSTEGLNTRLPVTSDEGASVRLELDKTVSHDSAEIRVVEGKLELSGRSDEALARAATFFATTFPHLPDGTRLEELEQNLEAFFENKIRVGGLASVAAQLGTVTGKAKRALMPNPLSCSPKLLDLPVRNTVRDGKRQRWQVSFRWEGTRFLEAIDALELASDKLEITAFLSEAPDVRERLSKEAKRRLQKRGVSAKITIHSAYKPGLFWLLEHLAPRAKQAGAFKLQINCAPHPDGLEVEDRWLRELYPVAEILEQRYSGLEVGLELAKKQLMPYEVRANDAKGKILLKESFEPPTHERFYLGDEKLGRVHPTTGWLKVHRGREVLRDQHLATDRDLAWDWYTETVLKDVCEKAHGPGPFFADLTINFSASEPDIYLGIDHEHASAVEAMHEEFYFGTLEALSQSGKDAFQERQIAPGWVLPFCKIAPEKDVSIEVIKHSVGSLRLGIETNKEFLETPMYPAKVRAKRIIFRSDQVRSLELEVETSSAKAARFLEAKLRWLKNHRQVLPEEVSPLPYDLGLEVIFMTSDAEVSKLSIRPLKEPKLKPIDLHKDRPLSPEDVVQWARAFKQKFPAIHLAPVSETRLGHPLVSLEATSLYRNASPARLAAWKPTVLVSARQHANEPTSTPANFLWLSDSLSSLLKTFNIIFNPLENPDGARLYKALCQHAPHHMHHAARYTSLGSDVQVTRTDTKCATRQLHEAIAERWSPLVHLNNHGYPAHEWTRPHSGYVPKHFEDWSLPFGYLTILIAAPTEGGLMRLVQREVASSLKDSPLVVFTAAQVGRGRRYQASTKPPFEFITSLPFLCRLRQDEGSTLDQTTSTLLTVISEVPDETVDGDLWQACVDAHIVINQAVLSTVAQNLTERDSHAHKVLR